MTVFFKMPKPEYHSNSDLLQKEKQNNSSDNNTLNDWTLSDAKVFIVNTATDNPSTLVSDDDAKAYIQNNTAEKLFLLSPENQYIRTLLKQYGLNNYRVFKYIKTFGNTNGFLAAGQIAITELGRLNPQAPSPIYTDNRRYTFCVRDEATVEYIEESDVSLNPSNEYGKGEKIARLKVVSIICINDHDEIQHTFHSAFLKPYCGKKSRCIKYFGNNESVIVKLINNLKKIFIQLIALFKTAKQHKQGSNNVPLRFDI